MMMMMMMLGGGVTESLDTEACYGPIIPALC
jgi:hypothetical protein